MKNRKLLAILLLSLSFCFVSGVEYGEVIIPQQSRMVVELIVEKGTVKSYMKEYERLPNAKFPLIACPSGLRLFEEPRPDRQKGGREKGKIMKTPPSLDMREFSV